MKSWNSVKVSDFQAYKLLFTYLIIISLILEKDNLKSKI